jgi:peptidoglycan/LPS O-acetylase OafA/YrhL
MEGTATASVEDKVRVPALDLLRLVAVIGVVLFHYGFRGPTGLDGNLTALPELAPFARYGFLGVPVFFVISGFVIAYSAEGRTAAGFAIARFARIYPGFLFCMTLTFLALVVFGAPQFNTGVSQWLANLMIAAPQLGRPYMDSAYWSLVIEVVFYTWVAALIAIAVFPRRIDLIVVVWLGISVLNESTIDSPLVDKLLLTDYSGFFATGLLIYELYKGRRDAVLQLLLAAAIATAVFQAVHNLAWLRERTDDQFDEWIVAGVCLASILVIIWATRIRHLPLRPGLVIAIGGVTYPLYLLHQQVGYTFLYWISPVASPAALVLAVVLAIVAGSWATWRFVERPLQRLTRRALHSLARPTRLETAAKPRELPSKP